MHQFIRGGDEAYTDLERRARRACVTFPQQEMPRGTIPELARIGFEVDRVTGEALLLVQKGLTYTGPNPEVREWMASGTKRFPDFFCLKEWIRCELADAYQQGTLPAVRPPGQLTATTAAGPARGTEDLTDFTLVLENLPDHKRPLYISPDAIYQELQRHILGQDEALKLLARRVARHLARRVPSRPATLLALGPTGVGKTQTAECLVPALRALDPVGVSYSYLRLDMSEYQERHRVSQLLGSPQGYIGYEDSSQLIDALVNNSKTVVLFDEIEKAHRDIFQSLMNAMDAGRLSSARPRGNASSQGREVDCREAIFIFTCNLDASSILADIEAQNAFSHPTRAEEICRTHLRAKGIPAELIGRINTFLVFRPLSVETRAEILVLSIVRVAREYGVEIAYIEPSVITAILAQAYTADFGARPDVYLVDDLLGAAFEDAARNYAAVPMKICGSSLFQCVPYRVGVPDSA